MDVLGTDGLGWQAWYMIGVLLVVLIALVREWARPEFVMLGAIGLLLVAGILGPAEAFAGFSNGAVLAVAALFVVAAGIQHTEAFRGLDHILPKEGGHLTIVMARIMAPMALLSAFLNNTPLVAMMLPRVQQWANKVGISPSKVLIPLSYATIMGGTITLIGTSTNIVVSGLLVQFGDPGLGMFELTWIGLPVAVAGISYFAFVGYRLLPSRGTGGTLFADGLRDCLFEVRVSAGSPMAGGTIEEANLRALKTAYLVHIRRDGRLIPTSPTEVVQPGDILTFAGAAEALEELLRRPGLERVLNTVGEEYSTLPLYEAVVAPTSNLVGKTLKETQFRERYHGVVLAVQRKDERLSGPLGQTALRSGDLLLVEAHNGFDKQWNADREEFYLVAPRGRRLATSDRVKRAPVAILILVTMVGCVALGFVPLVTAAFVAALAMIATGCVRGSEARRSLDLQVLVIIAAALGLGRGVQETGLAAFIAHGIIDAASGFGLVAVLAALYLATNLLTELIANTAAAALMIPVALTAAADLGVPPHALAVVVAVAASCSFMTPIGYQTNLMVLAAGGYRFTDYFKAGLPVSLIALTVTVLMVYLVWL